MTDVAPLVPAGNEIEPILLIDRSGSMGYPAAENSKTTRWDVVTEALGIIVTALGVEDSQAEAEAAAGEDAGGLMTVAFSNEAVEVGDLNEGNWRDKWNAISPGGGTHIMPAWTLAVEDYMDEFGKRPKEERPALLLLVITDGEAADMAQFEAECAKAHGNTYIAVAVVGYGPDHDKTLGAYNTIQANNPNVRVISFDGGTDPNAIAHALISLAS